MSYTLGQAPATSVPHITYYPNRIKNVALVIAGVFVLGYLLQGTALGKANLDYAEWKRSRRHLGHNRRRTRRRD